MNSNDMLKLLNEMPNIEKNLFLDTLYEEYFRVASNEQICKDAKILQDYYDGELVYVTETY